MKRSFWRLVLAAVMGVTVVALAVPAFADVQFADPAKKGGGPPEASGDLRHPNGSTVTHTDTGACVTHFRDGEQTGITGNPDAATHTVYDGTGPETVCGKSRAPDTEEQPGGGGEDPGDSTCDDVAIPIGCEPTPIPPPT